MTNAMRAVQTVRESTARMLAFAGLHGVDTPVRLCPWDYQPEAPSVGVPSFSQLSIIFAQERDISALKALSHLRLRKAVR